ncbi:MAG: DUF882 domain-containing protein [Candidatus Margulisbacteria bacterium]|nr:DUF882 domain-containing protein [Candidatus Margulisiibacteriota bacterium]MBU1021886.1 DUF882 domain-containing protein [Candidatus Margulisiibacteriota bacterium]MBU1728524.1 DUF882 domain-containing protein [Candidatus Margulisiibacteriota bacterium]MBU1954671.1 DUF882 domain-containing protein [Candidatus Margulisiibacteriota bacterium]
MGDLSEHFNHKDFICRCNDCRGQEFKIHLGLVGVLEELGGHFRKPVKIVQGFRCEAENDREEKSKKSFHTFGKAVHIIMRDVSPKQIIEFLRTLDEVRGIGLNTDDNTIHIDTRREDRQEWVREGKNRYSPMSTEKKKQYGLI